MTNDRKGEKLRIAFVTEYRPMTCGGVIFDALFEELRRRVNIEGVAVGPRRTIRASRLNKVEGVRIVGYISKHFRDFELRMRLRGYALYHFQSLRYAKVAAKRHPSIVTVYDIIPLKGVVPKSEGSKRRMRERLRWLAGVDAVQAISETVKRDLIDLAGIDEDKIYVASAELLCGTCGASTGGTQNRSGRTTRFQWNGYVDYGDLSPLEELR